MRCANYEIVEDSQDCLLIQDIGPWDRYPTITNSVEEVVRQLKNILGKLMKILLINTVYKTGSTGKIVQNLHSLLLLVLYLGNTDHLGYALL